MRLTSTRSTVCVLGGSSVGTPILIEEMARAQLGGLLPPLRLQLFGRAKSRQDRVVEHARFRLSRLPIQTSLGRQDIAIEQSTELCAALTGANLILCQIRPGGMSGRALDEALSIAYGLPGDEGLGPSGLCCFLRGIAVMDLLHQSIQHHAPGVTCLHLTSPLGLTVARARRRHGIPCFGVCELPTTTITKVRRAVAAALGTMNLKVTHAGLNHQAWLYAFYDDTGRDRISEVLEAIDDARLVGVEPAVIR
jgi:6-phospho-beta-glucosidase